MKNIKNLDNRGISNLNAIVRGGNVVVCIQDKKYIENICRFAYKNDDMFKLSMANNKVKWQRTPFSGIIN